MITCFLIYLWCLCSNEKKEQRRIYRASSDELRVGMTRGEVIYVMTNHVTEKHPYLLGPDYSGYSTDSDGTMHFTIRQGAWVEKERLVVYFDENNKVKSWDSMTF